MKALFHGLAVLTFLLFCSCGEEADPAGKRVLHFDCGGIIKALDPAQAADLSSRDMAGNFYDTLFQYDYTARPYRLMPSMLRTMPDCSGKVWECELRDDLYFTPDPCFGADGGSREARKVTSDDVIFTLKRLADVRRASPVYWLLRGKIEGLEAFRDITAKAPKDDDSCYDIAVSGLQKIDARRFRITLCKPDPRFAYNLAIPSAGIVSRKACRFYRHELNSHVVGSGPFRLTGYIRDYRMILDRNPEYREEFYGEAETLSDRTRPLPLADRIVCSIVKQPISSWLLFLQGELDLAVLDKDNVDMVTGGGKTLSPALQERKIRLLRAPLLEIRYIGFNLNDPKLGKNRKLRQALSLAYDIDRRIEYSNYQLSAANGPVPPGAPGHDENAVNPWRGPDWEKAKKLLAEAGYPGGIDPETGEPLTLTFDQNGSSSLHRQQGELMVLDMAKIGVKIIPVLNNGPRFFARLRSNQMQLFRLSWVGDYPDGENFLQLFYGPNCGGSNRAGYANLDYDRAFEMAITLPDGPERTAAYEKLSAMIVEDAPWIFESYPISYRLSHDWLENYRPHDFAFSRWKYLTVNPEKRDSRKKTFMPMKMKDLQE